MKRFPLSPFIRASRRQQIAFGIVAGLFGSGALAFGGTMASYAHKWGRLSDTPVIVILTITLTIGAGFLDAAYALIFSSRRELLGRFTLFAIGGFLCAIPFMLLAVTLGGLAKPGSPQSLALTLPAIVFGLLAIRLAWVRTKQQKYSNQPVEPTSTAAPRRRSRLT
jgi:hypothetical protein